MADSGSHKPEVVGSIPTVRNQFSGINSVVECLLAMQNVTSSNLVSRSTSFSCFCPCSSVGQNSCFVISR